MDTKKFYICVKLIASGYQKLKLDENLNTKNLNFIADTFYTRDLVTILDGLVRARPREVSMALTMAVICRRFESHYLEK